MKKGLYKEINKVKEMCQISLPLGMLYIFVGAVI